MKSSLESIQREGAAWQVGRVLWRRFRLRLKESLCLAVMLFLPCGMAACNSANGERSEPRNGTGSGAAPGCTDDGREEDDTLEQALATRPVSRIYSDPPRPLQLEGSVACPGDSDWIHAYGDCCYQMGAVVRWDASLGSLDVQLLDEKGHPLPLNQPGDIVERKPGEVRLLGAESGGHFLVHIRASGTVAVPYSVSVYAPVFVR